MIHSERRGTVTVLTIDNPPVNGLAATVRRGLAEGLAAAEAEPEVKAVVITGAGRMFSGGADIREFGKPPAADAPNLPELIDRIELSNKIVVAALHGVAAGGGAEVALGCHYRVAASGTRIGLPEVKLGLLPGAGGTQRLPRLVGVEPALELIVGGELIAVERGLELGLIDELAESNVVSAAIELALRVLTGGGGPRRTRDTDTKIQEAHDTPEVFDAFRASMARRARGFEAPWACVDCVESALSLPFAEGLKQERKTFIRLLTSEQSRAQRHVFFAEREVAKIPDVPRDTPAKKIARAAVVGCGTMGGGIAMNFANAGIPVQVLEVERDVLNRGLETIRRNYASTVSRGRLSAADMEQRMTLLTGTTRYEDLADADIVIEAVFEDMDLKKQIFRRLDAVCKADAILATNTSTLDVDEIAASTGRPDRVMGTHFFSPANIMRLMENVRGAQTSAETLATVMKLSKALGKVGVLVGVCDGFVGNRMLYAYTREANFLLEEGALPRQIDKVLYDFGFPMGPFAMGDLAGLDVGWRVRQARAPKRPRHLRYSPIADRICELGRFGQKTGAGWYRYEQGSRTPIPDPQIESLIVSVSEEFGIRRRHISDEEIIERCLYPLINEGARILEEGIAARALDLDIIWIYGYGFPRYRGGPMFHADQIGLDEVYAAMRRMYDQHGEWLKPAPLLERLAAQGTSFGEHR